MRDLHTIDPNNAESEKFFQIGGLPIMVCVLTFSDERYILGFSVSTIDRFDPDIAKGLSRRNAKMGVRRMTGGRDR